MAIGPGNLVATAISPTRIDLSWTNRGEYDTIYIERRVKDTPPWVEIRDNIGGESEFYVDDTPPLTSEVTYEYQIRAIFLSSGIWTDYSNVAEATTFAVLAAPTLCVATAFSNFIEVTFKDNSSEEVKFQIARKKDGDAWVLEFAWTAANMDYYRDEAVVPGSVYQYKVLAWRAGGDVSAFSNVSSATALSVPGDPADLVISEVQDTSMRLTWNGAAVVTETGYRIEISDTGAFGGEEETLEIGADIETFLVTGLDSSQQYWFRVYAYNGVGDSAAFAAANNTTLAAGVYTPTKFEEWIRNPNIEPVYLAEIYTKMDLTTFAHESGKVWKKTIGASDRGIDILEVFENGSAYSSAPDSIETVEALASSFWFHYDSRTLYVRSSAGDGDPAAFLIEGAFWLYFSTHKDIEFTVNGRLQHFLPFLAKEDIPDITQEIKPYYEGSFLISSGSIAFLNGEIGGSHFFDIKYATYTWENGKLVLKAGKDDFAYADFKTILTSFIDQKSCNDSKITFSLRDLRQEMERDLVLNKFWKHDQGDGRAWYPDIEDDFVGEPIPLCFGTKFGVTPIPIDVYNKKYKFHDGRSERIIKVCKDDAVLIEDTDYFVDLQKSIITFETDFEVGEEDIVEIDFIGSVNSANVPIVNGADIFKYLMNNHYELSNSELNLDSIYRAKREKTAALAIFLYKDTPYREIVRTIEHSMEAYTFQDTEGRLGLKAQLATAESSAKYISNHQVFAHQQSRARSSLFWKVNVWYNEKPQSQEWDVKWAQDDAIWYRYKNRNILNVHSYFSYPYNAQTLATSMLALLNKETIENTVPMLLFDVMAGDIIKFRRDRFYSTEGSIDEGSEIDLRIIRISKSPASGQTTITTELVV